MRNDELSMYNPCFLGNSVKWTGLINLQTSTVNSRNIPMTTENCASFDVPKELLATDTSTPQKMLLIEVYLIASRLFTPSGPRRVSHVLIPRFKENQTTTTFRGHLLDTMAFDTPKKPTLASPSKYTSQSKQALIENFDLEGGFT